MADNTLFCPSTSDRAAYEFLDFEPGLEREEAIALAEDLKTVHPTMEDMDADRFS
jgi:hypothetical protein